MNRTVYIFLCCLLPLCHLSEAAARSWTYGHVLRRNLWNLSENVAGIRQDSLSRSYAELYGKWSSGGFRDSWQAADTWSAGAMTESIRHFDKFSLKGSFSFDQTEGYGMCGSMFMKPGYYPLDVLEFTPGRKTRQTYALEGGFSADLAPNWRLGANVDFSSANLAKRKDLRHMNWRLDMTVVPGFMYHNGPFSVGAAYVFSKNSEVIESEQAGSSEFSYYAFLDKGMMYGTYSVWDGSGVHLAEEGIKGFPLKEIKNGASVQFAAGDFFADAQYLHSSGTAGEKESVWFRFPGDEVALKAGYRVVRGESYHYVRLGMDWKRQVTDESVLEKVSENGVASVVCHGSNRIAERRMWGLAPEYEYMSGLWELRAHGEVRGVNSLSSQMYPYLYSQELVTFSADVSALVHIWKFDVGAVIGCAGGFFDEHGRMASDDSGVQTSPFRLQDWYDLQMEYKTAPRINAALSCRFWCWKGLYCRVAAEWAHGFGLSHIKGADRYGASLGVGYEF